MNLHKSQKLQFFLIAGHIIECFDNTLYGFFAVILAPLFFPSDSSNIALLGSYVAFLAGFLARPLGAIFFGHMGDTKGRRNALLYSMAFVGIPTIMISLLPTYEAIGIFAPLILIFCRLSQGFFMGGEFAGANLYVIENFVPGTIGKATGLLIFSGVMGAVLATLFGALVTLPLMPAWGWRVPFFVGGLCAYIVYAIRRKMIETVDFSQLKESKQISANPWEILLKEHKKRLFVACLIAGLTIIPLYCTTILGNRLFKELGYSSSECMILNTFAMIVDGLAILYFGRLADKLGFHCQINLGILLIALIALPSFIPLADNCPSLWEVLWFISSLVITGSIINGCAMPYIAGYFPTYCRFSGIALSITLGHAIFGGTTPLVGSYLTDTIGSRIAPAFWVIGLSLVTLTMIKIVGKPQYSKQ